MNNTLKHLLFIATFILGPATVCAQKIFDNGAITYKMTTRAQDPQAGEIAMEADVEFHIAEKEARTAMTMNVMGMAIKMESLINSESRTGLVLMEFFGQKMAARVTPDDYDDLVQKNKDFEVEKVVPAHETREILGYSCKKAIATTKEGMELEVYYTESIKPVSIDGLGNINMKGINGLPLAYTMQTPDAHLTFEATKIKEGDVDPSDFNYDIPEGYEEISYSQLSRMSSGM
ncbi:DUF4412 domain-containing protein [Sinomicrobium pectinilyticum]|uniref:DUF4412 domain-containing protein n=1 Tax=Sinomicrobium pectinilyticum TaxID=1084421 RepID=A0A3N0EH10_SINP1|nr:DUF4412 domain-containing protein [Sinomicrobium pectinilyticum]RNL87064.1 DUF4412 domain-containing protein [Sinomicrobium pectinilyticum]